VTNANPLFSRVFVLISCLECRTLIRTLILGTRNVISAMTQSQFVPLGQGQQQPPALVSAGPMSKAQLVEEATIFSKLFKNITRCMSIFTVPPSLSPAEEKEVRRDQYICTIFLNVNACFSAFRGLLCPLHISRSANLPRGYVQPHGLLLP
jgi:hypothetical protein